KYYGNIVALKDISTYVNGGEVTCILGDNGAGKSSFIKILSGVHQADSGRLVVDGEEVQFTSPRDARAKGIATVYQDLAMVPLMSVWRNFFLGAEPTRRLGPLRQFDIKFAKKTVRDQLHEMGIDIRDPDQAVGTLSGGERQAAASSRSWSTSWKISRAPWNGEDGPAHGGSGAGPLPRGAARRARRRRAPLLRRLLRDLRPRQRRGARRSAVREPGAPHLLSVA